MVIQEIVEHDMEQDIIEFSLWCWLLVILLAKLLFN